MPSEITCLIVDDHEVVREGLRLSLSRAPHIRVVGEAADGKAAIDLAERRKPNVVIMDVRMPGLDGLDATKELVAKEPNSAVLIFTAYSERSLLARGLESGAKGYILKEAPHETLVRAIEKVANGDSFIDPALMPAFLSGKDREDMLTAREREILQLLADGMSNADAAALHQPGDREEPRPPHPGQARGRHAHARSRDRFARRDHRLVEQQNEGNESARLAERLITAEQDERRRLALFLHDGPVQSLSGIALMLDAVIHSLEQGELEPARDLLTDALERQRAAIRTLRELSFNLEPVVLRDHGFTPAVQALADELGLRRQIKIDVDVAAAEQLGEKVQAALYQIVREALDGAVRRGPPTQIAVSVERTADGRFVTTIADNGSEERRREFFDMIAERARTLSGRLSVDQEAGTKIVLELPGTAAGE